MARWKDAPGEESDLPASGEEPIRSASHDSSGGPVRGAPGSPETIGHHPAGDATTWQRTAWALLIGMLVGWLLPALGLGFLAFYGMASVRVGKSGVTLSIGKRTGELVANNRPRTHAPDKSGNRMATGHGATTTGKTRPSQNADSDRPRRAANKPLEDPFAKIDWAFQGDRKPDAQRPPATDSRPRAARPPAQGGNREVAREGRPRLPRAARKHAADDRSPPSAAPREMRSTPPSDMRRSASARETAEPRAAPRATKAKAAPDRPKERARPDDRPAQQEKAPPRGAAGGALAGAAADRKFQQKAEDAIDRFRREVVIPMKTRNDAVAVIKAFREQVQQDEETMRLSLIGWRPGDQVRRRAYVASLKRHAAIFHDLSRRAKDKDVQKAYRELAARFRAFAKDIQSYNFGHLAANSNDVALAIRQWLDKRVIPNFAEIYDVLDDLHELAEKRPEHFQEFVARWKGTSSRRPRN